MDVRGRSGPYRHPEPAFARARAEDDADAKCILLWVAFNAAYVIERKAELAQWGRLDEWP